MDQNGRRRSEEARRNPTDCSKEFATSPGIIDLNLAIAFERRCVIVEIAYYTDDLRYVPRSVE